MKALKRTTPSAAPIRVLQFGEGNFLRAYADWMIQQMNKKCGFDAAIQMIQPRGSAQARKINAQDGLYHVILRGVAAGQPTESIELIECVAGCWSYADHAAEIAQSARLPGLRWVFSNTTEAGIVYEPGNPAAFPARVAALLAIRARTGLPGLVFIPCELLENNGDLLKTCVLRYLAADPVARRFAETQCVFCNTLVDRIVAGYPQEEAASYQARLGVADELMTVGEPFFFMAIAAPAAVAAEFPARQAGLEVVFAADITPYRVRKVRCLNGAHTVSALAAHLAGFTYVDEMMRDLKFASLLHEALFDEILPTIALDETEKRAYADAVLTRFANPYAKHRLLSIALNSVAKWRVRVLPTLLDYRKMFGRLPVRLTSSLASLIDFYRSGASDDTPEVQAFFATDPDVPAILARTDFWGMDLNDVPGFTAAVTQGVTRR